MSKLQLVPPLPELRVGFTGTRKGMTAAQLSSFFSLFLSIRDNNLGQQLVLDQGCCVGSDEHSAVLAHVLGARIIGHPPENGHLISKLAMRLCTEVRSAKYYTDRNMDIVNETSQLIATTLTDDEVNRSGTWATVRYAMKQDKPVTLILPGGTVKVVESLKGLL